MPSAPSVIFKGKLYEITFRTEEGLPLAPTKTLMKIIRSHLGAAATMYRIRPVAWKYMGNHVEDHITRDTIPALSSPSLTDQEDERLALELAEKSNKQYVENFL